MKLITDDLIDAVADEMRREPNIGFLTYHKLAEFSLKSACPMIVRRCLRHIDQHHDDFIDGNHGKEYFETVDEILVTVRAALREMIEEEG